MKLYLIKKRLEVKMVSHKNRLLSNLVCLTTLIFSLVYSNSFAQLVTNGGFESSSTGIKQTGDVKGWLLLVGSSITSPPVFEIVSDTVEEGTRALKVSVFGTGTNQWDVQTIADSIPVKQGTTYNYSVWAKAQNSGAQVNFTVGGFSTGEYAAIRPANLTTKWQKFILQFKITDNQTYVRAPIHFSYAGNINNIIYIDNLQIDSLHIDVSKYYKGPPLAQGLPKFLGNVMANDGIFANYWNQITPGNEGKWASIAGASSDTTKWNWGGLDAIYNYAKQHNIIFKDHNLIWGAQQPTWISAMDSATQIKYIETWIRMVGARYPDIDMIDVVNEPLLNHNRPDGTNGNANYIKALGGLGKTGWDWVITAFTLARKYLPHAKLLINDFNIINSDDATYTYTYVINLLKSRSLIDGIGVQCHNFEIENTSVATMTNNLTKLAATGLPIYISEMDMGNTVESGTANDAQQLAAYKKVFPALWQHNGVKGITLWGYIEAQMWQPTCFLVHTDGTWRPAMTWMAQYIKDNPTGIKQTAEIIPSEFKLEQNYPNPFNPTTNISYSILNATKVTLKIFDVLGREIKTLVNSEQRPGRYTVTFDGKDLSSGIYFYKLNAGNFIATKKLMLIK
jgi:GH35 family endo-1,4-beta-xylanase